MADIVDVAAEITEATIAEAVRQSRNAVLAGTAGECDECEWWMPRLVDGRCAFCRDGRPRPPDWEPPPRPDEPTQEPTRETIMAHTKSIMLLAFATTAIAAVEQHAKDNDTTIGAAAAALIERGLAAPAAVDMPVPDDQPLSMRERLLGAIDVVAGHAAEILNQPDASAATARADAAEQEVASLREALQLETSRANAATDKLEAAKRLFA